MRVSANVLTCVTPLGGSACAQFQYPNGLRRMIDLRPHFGQRLRFSDAALLASFFAFVGYLWLAERLPHHADNLLLWGALELALVALACSFVGWWNSNVRSAPRAFFHFSEVGPTDRPKFRHPPPVKLRLVSSRPSDQAEAASDNEDMPVQPRVLADGRDDRVRS